MWLIHVMARWRILGEGDWHLVDNIFYIVLNYTKNMKKIGDDNLFFLFHDFGGKLEIKHSQIEPSPRDVEDVILRCECCVAKI